MMPCQFRLLALWIAALLPVMAPPVTSLAFAAAPAGGAVQQEQARRFIAELGAQAINVLRQPGQPIEQREAALSSMLTQKFALDFIGRFALGRYWATVSAEQQEEFIALFSEFVLRKYASMLGGYVDEHFTVQGAAGAGQRDMIVSSRITGGGREPMRVDWRVRLIGGSPKVIDVAVEGVSMSITQREEFSAMVQRYGIEGLLEVLRARTLGLPAEGPS